VDGYPEDTEPDALWRSRCLHGLLERLGDGLTPGLLVQHRLLGVEDPAPVLRTFQDLLTQILPAPGFVAMHVQRDLEASCTQFAQRLALIVIDNMRDGDLDENRPSIMGANDIDTVDAYRGLFPELCQRPQLGRLHDGRLTEAPVIEPMGCHGLQRLSIGHTGHSR